MGIRIGIGNLKIGQSSFSWSRYWAQSGLFLFFGETSKITGGILYNQVKGATDYLTVTGTVGSYHYTCPNTPTYVAADTDFAWFKSDGSVSDMTDSRLNSYDVQRTPVKFDDNSPNTNRWIGILKLTTNITPILDKLFKSFDLPIEWHDDTNAYGHIKSNRTGQNLWVPESVSTLLTGLTSYWKLDDSASNNIIDSVGVNGGVKVGTGITQGQVGKVGTSILFTGSGRYNCGNNASLDVIGNNPCSVSFWLKTAVTSSFWGIINKGTTHLDIGVNIDKVSFVGVAFSDVINDGNWHHIVCIYDSTKLLVYTDSVVGASFAYSAGMHVTADNFSIGGRTDDSAPFLGTLDEVGFWNNKALTQDEVDELYNSGNGISYPF
jgi:hypothetical protein